MLTQMLTPMQEWVLAILRQSPCVPVRAEDIAAETGLSVAGVRHCVRALQTWGEDIRSTPGPWGGYAWFPGEGGVEATPGGEYVCVECGTVFSAAAGGRARAAHRFCSFSCAASWRWRQCRRRQGLR
ncbi:HTH domain-containing protein [Tepidiforma bonchosmolovskayae]|uniref:HTH domain-containing protein n=1 Tax=Tepidiforma bonchosmolovskayae TaxID=2601677 RepID=A0ABX6BZA9_9CHLR|nr:HTH domain-containing protein [Tepidiforma bonchosmolovskayae]